MGYKIKISNLIFFLISLCVMYECKWFNIIGLTGIWVKYIRIAICLGLFIFCKSSHRANRKICKQARFMNKFILILVVIILFEMQHTMRIQEVSAVVVIEYIINNFVCFLLVYPLLYLFQENSFEKICNWLSTICFGSIVIQLFVAIIYNLSGEILLPQLIRSEGWSRNDMIRISSTCLSWFVIIYCISKLLDKTRLKKQNTVIICTLTLMYVFLVNQSRAQYTAIIAAIVLMVLFNKASSTRQIIIGFCTLVVAVFFIQSGILDSLINKISSLSTNDTIGFRLYKMDFISKLIQQYPVGGMGFIHTNDILASQRIYFADFGLIGDYLHYGVFSLYIYIVTIIRIISTLRIIAQNKGKGESLLRGILWYLVFGIIGFTCIDGGRIFSLPCIWAIEEHIRYNALRSNR